MNYQIKYDKEKYYSCVDEKSGKRSSGKSDESKIKKYKSSKVSELRYIL